MRLHLLAGVSALALGVAAFGTAGPRTGAAAALWHPRRAWEATIAPVKIAATAREVDRGRSVDLDLEAVGRRAATVWLRSRGEPWRPVGVRLDSLGRATLPTGPLDSDLYARATSGSRASDTIVVRVRVPAFVGALSITAHYPTYLGLQDEPMPAGGDTVTIPAGTRLETRGEASTPLARAEWRRGAAAESLTVRGTAFRGSFVPRRSAEYRLALVTAGGAPLAGEPPRLPVRVVPDSAPLVEVPLPGADTVAPLNLLVPLVVDARDDHGVAAIAVESRRISRQGLADAVARQPVPLPAGGADRVIVPLTLDLTRRGLLPGDTVRYWATATDNAPARQRGRSREFVLRLPTMDEVRAATRRVSEAVGGRMDSLVAASRRVERQTDDLSREQPRPAMRPGEGRAETLSYEEARRAAGATRSQQQLLKDAEALRRSLETLRRTAAAAGVGDTAWARQLDEVRRELERALSPELRERLASLQRAVKDLDADATRTALEQLAEAQKQLREALERSRELFRRAALEGDLANLRQESRELAQEQRRWADQVAPSRRPDAAADEQRLAARADSLGSALARAAQTAPAETRRDRLEAMGRSAAQAARQMRQAAGSAERGDRAAAQRQGDAAARALEPLGDELQAERERMQRAWRQETVQALDQALAETGRLAERQLAVAEALRSGGEPTAAARAEQAAIEEGVQQVMDQVRRASGKNALVPPQIGAALGAARQQMRDAREALSAPPLDGRGGAEQAGGAVDALNAAAHQLLRARGDVSGAQSGSGLAEAMARMAELARQQGGLGQRGAGLLPMPGAGSLEGQIRQLGAQQRALAEELEKVRAGGEVPGAGELAGEARELARRMESGRLDRQTVERQERLFRRMLDAGRTLQGSDEDEQKERQSTVAADDSVRIPPALRAPQSDEGAGRMPTWEELQRLSPDERRLVADYFRRLSAAGGS